MKASLIVSAGKGCFMACKGCYQNFGNKLLETPELIRFISEFKSRYGMQKVTLSGGDPLSRKDIVFLINTLSQMGLSISMDTTGLPLIRRQRIVFNGNGYAERIDAEELVNVNMLGITLDGHTTEIINKFRCNVTLEDIKAILIELSRADISVCINTVVNLNNFLYLPNIFEIIKDFKCVKKWQLFQYSPIGEIAYRNRKSFEISEEMFNLSIESLSNLETSIKIEPKSNSSRKRKYILINSGGEVWTPLYSTELKFTHEDKGTSKIVFGYVTDDDEIWHKLDHYILKLL